MSSDGGKSSTPNSSRMSKFGDQFHNSQNNQNKNYLFTQRIKHVDNGKFKDPGNEGI